MDRRTNSAAWAAVGRTGASISTMNNSALAIQRQTWGKTASEAGDYLAAVLISASSYSGLITFMEQLEMSDEFATMRSASENKVVGTTIYQVAKVLNP